jgi:DDE superfamily endonuclease
VSGIVPSLPELKTKYINGLDKNRFAAQDPIIISDWFKLFNNTIKEFNIHPSDIYNMDEKGFMVGMLQRTKVIISKYQIAKYMMEPGNREWVSLIECISLDGRLLFLWVIFKGKKQNLAWMEMLGEGHIALSKNGWTDNELGLEWLKECFDPETQNTTNEYRLLLMDGHQSHITNEALRFCIASKIIVLCLPAHTTHLLQPLDVGPFRPLAIAYKTGIQERGYLNPVYSVDKLEFLEVYKTARLRGISKENIQKGWRNAGLEPFDPKTVLDLLPKSSDASSINELASDSIENSIERPSTPLTNHSRYTNNAS